MKRNLKGLIKFADSVKQESKKDTGVGSSSDTTTKLMSQQKPDKIDWQPVIDAVNQYAKDTGSGTQNANLANSVIDFMSRAINGGAPDNSKFDPSGYKSLIVGVGGFGEGKGGHSFQYFDWMTDKPNAVYLRHMDTKHLRRILDAARASSIPTIVAGHSYGGSEIADLADEYPETFFIASDPVSRFSRNKNKEFDNLVYHMPPSLTTYLNFGNLISLLGGRWHTPTHSTVYYRYKDKYTGEPYGYHSFSPAALDLKNVIPDFSARLANGLSSKKLKEYIQKKYIFPYMTYPYPETSKEYQDLHDYKGVVPPSGWPTIPVGDLQQIPDVFGEL